MKTVSIGDLDLFIEEEDNKLGIENWKKLSKFGVKLHNHVKKVMADNKVTWWEAIKSLKYVKGLADMVKLATELNQERKDFTESEFQEIIDIVNEGLDLGEETAAYIDKFLEILQELKAFGSLTA